MMNFMVFGKKIFSLQRGVFFDILLGKCRF